MNHVYLAFANNRQNPLPKLGQEDDTVYTSYLKLFAEGCIPIRDSFATQAMVINRLLHLRNTLTVFHYGGHAGHNLLELEDGHARAEGIAALLGRCPNLKLVVLNGCSTVGQVRALLDAGVPAVVATSVPVADEAAVHFSETFHTALCERNESIREAYEAGMGTEKTYTTNRETVQRWIFDHNEEVDSGEPVWGLFLRDNEPTHGAWQLSQVATQELPHEYPPNQLLLAAIWNAIEPHVAKAGESYSESQRADLIITSLPLPVSEFVRKLIAKRAFTDERAEDFYHDPSLHRLKYLIYTYTTSIELLAFTLLSQLWDEQMERGTDVFDPELRAAVDQLLHLDREQRRTYSFIPLVRLMRESMDRHGILPFIQEYKDISLEFNAGTEFHYACLELEALRDRVIALDALDPVLVQRYCARAEYSLALVMHRLGFLANYRLTSMKDVHFVRYKHQRDARYRMHFVDLKFRPAGVNIDARTLPTSIENHSIVFVKRGTTDDAWHYLNLSPFLIDQNSFSEKARLADLVVFPSFENAQRTKLSFRHLYRPLEQPWVVPPPNPFERDAEKLAKHPYTLIKAQLDAFLAEVTPAQTAEPHA